jgi:hypothetical protein
VSRRYAWRAIDRRKKGRAKERLDYLARQRRPAEPERMAESMRRRLELLAAVPRAAPGTDDNLWVPLGPTYVIDGSAGGRPRVTGRVRDLRISDDGKRAYAATANGGLWYTEDFGESWAPVGGWDVSTPIVPPATPPPPHQNLPTEVRDWSNILACGCLYVRFENAAADDEVMVGTGETLALHTAGVGVLRAVGPAAKPPFAGTWTREAKNLSGLGLYRLAADPDQAVPTTFVVATSAGLFTRQGAPAPDWTQVAAAPFGGDAGKKLVCTDVAWAKGQGGTATRLWVAVRDDSGRAPNLGPNSGLWMSEHGPAGPFTQVKLPALPFKARISVAVAPSDPKIVYALADNNNAWRVDDQSPTAILDLPPRLLGTQADYNQAIAVHPQKPERIVLGGQSEVADGLPSAALYLGDVTGPTLSTYHFSFTVPPGVPTTDPTFIGHGVHSDVHAARFVPAPGGLELWIGCDGGVFRSRAADKENTLVKNTFIPRNNGVAALECGFVATHPLQDGYSLTGTTDNGTLERVGDTLWRPRFIGDGGGIVFNPVAPNRFLRQYQRTAWNDEGSGTFQRPVLRSASISPAETIENNAAAFYSGADAVMVPPPNPQTPPTARLAFGTYRVWLSQNWGTSWVTLPSTTDPMVVNAQNNAVDPTVPGAAGPDFRSSQVVTCRWATPSRLFVLCARAVLQYDITVDATVPAGITVTSQNLTRHPPRKWAAPQSDTTVVSPGEVLPSIGFWTDLFVHDPSRGPHGSFYVAAFGDSATPAMDTLWWFDGTDRWHATGLRNDPKGVPAPVFAVVVDPAHSEIVYVGTAVGVWKGTFDAAGPKWTWDILSNGLPEATALDLAIFQSGNTRLLRAAMQSRGVWEVNLGGALPETYVRVHAWDTRRIAPASLVDPYRPVTSPALSWHASPDIRIRPQRGTKPPGAFGLPWSGASSDRYGLWVFQTALHRPDAANPGTVDPIVKPTGLWNPQFEARLLAARNSRTVTTAIYNAVVGSGNAFPNAYAEPWNGAEPTEADLYELVLDIRAPVGSPASMALFPVMAKVDVLVHHRHLTPVAGGDVKVALLLFDATGVPGNAWDVLLTAWRDPVVNLIKNGGATPALPNSWQFADGTTPVRSLSGPVDARLPRAATFTVDFTQAKAGTRFLLVAVVHSVVDPVSLPDVTLQPLVLGTRFVALRSVEIV